MGTKQLITNNHFVSNLTLINLLHSTIIHKWLKSNLIIIVFYRNKISVSTAKRSVIYLYLDLCLFLWLRLLSEGACLFSAFTGFSRNCLAVAFFVS